MPVLHCLGTLPIDTNRTEAFRFNRSKMEVDFRPLPLCEKSGMRAGKLRLEVGQARIHRRWKELHVGT